MPGVEVGDVVEAASMVVEGERKGRVGVGCGGYKRWVCTDYVPVFAIVQTKGSPLSRHLHTTPSPSSHTSHPARHDTTTRPLSSPTLHILTTRNKKQTCTQSNHDRVQHMQYY